MEEVDGEAGIAGIVGIAGSQRCTEEDWEAGIAKGARRKEVDGWIVGSQRQEVMGAVDSVINALPGGAQGSASPARPAPLQLQLCPSLALAMKGKRLGNFLKVTERAERRLVLGPLQGVLRVLAKALILGESRHSSSNDFGKVTFRRAAPWKLLCQSFAC